MSGIAERFNRWWWGGRYGGGFVEVVLGIYMGGMLLIGLAAMIGFTVIAFWGIAQRIG